MLDYFLNIIGKSTTIIATLIALIVLYLTFKAKGKIKLGNAFIDFSRKIDEEAETIKQRLIEASDDNSKKELTLLYEFYIQGLSQVKLSFRLSIIFAIIGFLFILASIFYIYEDNINFFTSSRFISLISGTIVESVASLFFIQTNKSRKLMLDCFDRLRTDEKMKLALDLAQKMSDKNFKSKLEAVLAINLAQVHSCDRLGEIILSEKKK